MANIQYQASGTPVSQVENDVAQTLNLAGSIVTIIREPIAHIFETYTKAQKIKKSLDIWQREILDENGQPCIPVLRHQELENHLEKTDGIIPAFQAENHKQNPDSSRSYRISWPGWARQSPESASTPAMPPAGTACWGYFLFALGIRPGMKTVSRRPSTDGFISTQNGGVEMEIDGSALCHVMNLYSTNNLDLHAPFQPTNRCRMSFGTLSWEMAINQPQVHAHFRPGIEHELASEKRPFSRYKISMDVGTIMVSYLTALHHSVSDQRFQLAAPQASLSERIERLLECFHMLGERVTRRIMSRRSRTTHQDIDGVIFSHEWFNQAASVKRRLLAQGGDDRSFFDDIHERCSTERERKGLGEFFFFGKEGFDFKPGIVERRSLLETPRLPEDIVMQVLLSYETCPAGSWKRSLFESREDVLRVAAIPKTIYPEDYAPMVILWYTPSSDIWDQTVLLGAPISAT
ncbi:hypothetical protein HER10_EVM0006904 [Colletotrichum scovillei]|uniref:uncharacterized protein n=1 Tax=Colletotrichum scovillei TaxID=1209932 RepID=UPI0015C3DE3E|nr:uncharacterized protein HER10_EVM0006904 [Colletotrichum scovillei]KAF4785501.1 hypothetical protein HER10_EVM0006904 [Colletotrichum scovillei]KAG7081967.1 hypothetical protein JMJ78_0004076 [Colletotrichum scovillei]